MTGDLQDLQGVLGVLVPIIAITMGVGMGFWSIYWDHQKKRLQYQERQLMIEKGLTPPPMLPDVRKGASRQDALRRGITLLSLGVGLGVAIMLFPNRSVAWLLTIGACVTGFLGLGNLLYFVVSGRMEPPATNDQPRTG